MTISRSGARWSGSNRFRTSSSLMPLNLSIFLFFFTVVWSVIFSCTIFFGLPAFFFGEFPVALNTQKQTINLEHNNKVKQYKQAFHLFISAVWSIYNSTVITCLVIEIMVNYYITFFHKCIFTESVTVINLIVNLILAWSVTTHTLLHVVGPAEIWPFIVPQEFFKAQHNIQELLCYS